MFSEIGIKVSPDDFKPFVVQVKQVHWRVAEKYGAVVDIEKVKDRTYQIYETIIQGKLKPLPGAFEFVALCRTGI